MNPSVATALEAAGMKIVGRNNDGTGERMEVLELEEDRHPYFMGAQVCCLLHFVLYLLFYLFFFAFVVGLLRTRATLGESAFNTAL